MAAGGDHVGRTGAITHPPAGHGERLGQTVDDDAALLQLRRQRGDADLPQAVVHHVLVNLVGDDVEAGVAQHVGEVLQLFGGVRRPGRVARTVKDDALRRRRQVAPQHLAGDFEVFRRRRRDDHRRATRHLHLRRIGHPIRTGNDHLVARIHQHHRQVVQDVLGAARHDDLFRLVMQTVFPLQFVRNRLSQRRQPARLRVLGETLGHGVLGGLNDVVGGVEVRLADAEVDHVAALSAQRLGLGADGQGLGGFQVAGKLCKLHRLLYALRWYFSFRASATGGGTSSSTLPP